MLLSRVRRFPNDPSLLPDETAAAQSRFVSHSEPSSASARGQTWGRLGSQARALCPARRRGPSLSSRWPVVMERETRPPPRKREGRSRPHGARAAQQGRAFPPHPDPTRSGDGRARGSAVRHSRRTEGQETAGVTCCPAEPERGDSCCSEGWLSGLLRTPRPQWTPPPLNRARLQPGQSLSLSSGSGRRRAPF